MLRCANFNRFCSFWPWFSLTFFQKFGIGLVWLRYDGQRRLWLQAGLQLGLQVRHQGVLQGLRWTQVESSMSQQVSMVSIEVQGWFQETLLPIYCSELKTWKSFQGHLSLTLMQVKLVEVTVIHYFSNYSPPCICRYIKVLQDFMYARKNAFSVLT